MQKDLKQKWENCLSVIRDIIQQPKAFEAWFLPIIPLTYENNKLTIQVPSHFFYEYLEEKYANVLKDTLNRVFGAGTILKYRVMVSSQEKKPAGNSVLYQGTEVKTYMTTPHKVDFTKAPIPFKVATQDLDPNLNLRYTFSNFYEGESNRLVKSVSEQIASDPGKTTFNPLFIFGHSGVGKTHICNAIGVKIRELYPEKRILYVSSNIFRLQYTDAVRKNVTNDFLSFYQSIDILMLDDIHELIGLTKTQEIFFQIFNNLHQLGKQLVLTCDRAPVDLQGLEERLISRLKWGMTAEIERPDVNLRKLILKNKVNDEGLDISDEIIDFITENVTDNVRDIEGVLVSLVGNSVKLNKDIDLQLAKQVVGQIVRLERKPVTIKRIKEVVCRYFNLTEEHIQSRSQKSEIVQARQIAMYFAKEYTDSSYALIGKVIGDKDHATVWYAVHLVKEQIKINKPFRAKIEALNGCLFS
jgi:chromosomal replication initiator protein